MSKIHLAAILGYFVAFASWASSPQVLNVLPAKIVPFGVALGSFVGIVATLQHISDNGPPAVAPAAPKA